MKIAFYGNSFAEDEGHKPESWLDKLARKFNAEWVSFGKGGSSLYYSYDKFLKNHKDYDLNIFVVTHWQNYNKEITLFFKDATRTQFRPNSLNNVEEMLERNGDKLESASIEMLNYMKGWFIVADEEYMILTWELMLKHMETLDPKIVYIASGNFYDKDFIHSDSNRRQQLGYRGLYEYDHRQKKDLGVHNIAPQLEEKPDMLTNHFTPDTTTVVADSVYSLITTGKMLPVPDTIPQSNPWDYYFELKK
jgi:hypothetical protein